MRTIVDADPIVYLAGFAGELHEYHLVLEDENGVMHQDFFSPMPEVDLRVYKKQLKEKGLTVVDQDLEVTPEPLDHCLNIVRSMVLKVQKDTNTKDLVVLLSGPGNFRDEIATIKPYKGNRKEDYKPYWYSQIRHYLEDRFGGRVVEGREADDEAGILMRQALEAKMPCVLATIDKDLDQVPGPHYNFKHHVHYEVSEDDALLYFYQQILSGDSTDNIPGLKGIGDATAAKLIAQWHEDWLEGLELKSDLTLEEFLWGCVLAMYEDVGIKGYDGPLHPHDQALEVARLVRIQQYPGEIWTPPGAFEE